MHWSSLCDLVNHHEDWQLIHSSRHAPMSKKLAKAFFKLQYVASQTALSQFTN
jgi:hypothetical protein